MKRLVIPAFGLLFCLSCTNLSVLYQPEAFETGDTLARGKADLGGGLGVLESSRRIFVNMPDIGLTAGYGITDRLTARLRFSYLNMLLTGSTARLNAVAACKFLDIGYVRMSASAGLGYLGSRSVFDVTGGTNRVTTGRLNALTVPAALNLGVWPFRKYFGIYANLGLDPMTGTVKGDYIKSFSFSRLYYTAAIGVVIQTGGMTLKFAWSQPVFNARTDGNTVMDRLSPEFRLYYVPAAAVELTFRIDDE